MLSSCEAMGKFSENLARLMRERGLNQVDLAKKSGIKQPLISHYLTESKWACYPSLKSLIALAHALRVSLDDLTGLESLKGIEKETDAIGDLTDEEKAMVEAYNSLPDDDWRRKAIDKILLKTDKEVDKKKDSKDKAE